MTCERDGNGKLLSDEKRLTNYGKKLRSTSLDELPELFNIVNGSLGDVQTLKDTDTDLSMYIVIASDFGLQIIEVQMGVDISVSDKKKFEL